MGHLIGGNDSPPTRYGYCKERNTQRSWTCVFFAFGALTGWVVGEIGR
jgi:hypothetical protein